MTRKHCQFLKSIFIVLVLVALCTNTHSHFYGQNVDKKQNIELKPQVAS